MYKTNQQAWNEVMRNINQLEKDKAMCQKLFGQDNLVGLSNEQRDLFYKSI